MESQTRSTRYVTVQLIFYEQTLNVFLHCFAFVVVISHLFFLIFFYLYFRSCHLDSILRPKNVIASDSPVIFVHMTIENLV